MPFIPADRVALGTWPTPLEAAPRLAEALGLGRAEFWIKRDDLTGLGAGGNKVRKLEWTVATALAEGADTLVTTGAPQSNHARLTAAAAARVGMDAVLVFPGRPPEQHVGNLVLDGLLGATIILAGKLAPGPPAESSLAAAAEGVVARLRAEGRRPALIPYGGSDATGAHGYRLAGQEIERQLPEVSLVVCAVGSGGTMAGLVAGLGADRLYGVDTGAMADPGTAVARLLREMGEPEPGELRLRTDQVGEGYSTLTPGAAGAMTLAARTEGLLLDPIYSARALAGLEASLRDGDVKQGGHIVFLASGGLPGLFGNPGAVALGAEAVSATQQSI